MYAVQHRIDAASRLGAFAAPHPSSICPRHSAWIYVVYENGVINDPAMVRRQNLFKYKFVFAKKAFK